MPAHHVDLSRIKAISFDLDDTLWAIMPVIERAEEISREWLIANYPNTAEFFDTQSIIDLRKEVFAEFPDLYYDLTFLRKECIARILASGGYDRSGVKKAFEIFKHQRDTVDVYEDVMPFFDGLHQRYTRIALTNGNASLERTPLKEIFHTYISARCVKAPKPEARIFREALERHELEPEEMLHVGDCLVSDVGGAVGLGIPTVWVNRFSRAWDDTHSRPHFVVNNFEQLGHLLP